MMPSRELILRMREQKKTRDHDGNIIICSNWRKGRYCVLCPDRIWCDVLGKHAFREDFWNPSRRKQ